MGGVALSMSYLTFVAAKPFTFSFEVHVTVASLIHDKAALLKMNFF